MNANGLTATYLQDVCTTAPEVKHTTIANVQILPAEVPVVFLDGNVRADGQGAGGDASTRWMTDGLPLVRWGYAVDDEQTSGGQTKIRTLLVTGSRSEWLEDAHRGLVAPPSFTHLMLLETWNRCEAAAWRSSGVWLWPSDSEKMAMLQRNRHGCPPCCAICGTRNRPWMDSL
jgi:hypothetical protein